MEMILNCVILAQTSWIPVARRESAQVIDDDVYIYIFGTLKLVCVFFFRLVEGKWREKRQFDFYHTVYTVIVSSAAISQRKKYLSATAVSSDWNI